METDPEPRKSRWVVVLLWLVPLWLIVSAGVGIWLYLRSKESDARKEVTRYVTAVSETAMADDLTKLAKIIGPRNPGIDSGKGLTRAASWIEGMLGPSNTGYTIQKLDGPDKWPLLQINLTGTRQDAPAVWVVTSYDTAGSSGDGDPAASTVVSVIAAAQDLAGDDLQRTVKFIFLPHGNDTASAELVSRTRARLVQVLREERSHAILCAGRMGGGTNLVVSSPADENPVFPLVGNLGKVVKAEGPDLLGTSLFVEHLPAVDIATSHATGARTKDLAIATGRLVELIRLAAGKK